MTVFLKFARIFKMKNVTFCITMDKEVVYIPMHPVSSFPPL